MIKPLITTTQSNAGSIQYDLAVSQWFWVKDEKDEWLGCIVDLGSNYAKLKSIDGGTQRVHFDEFDATCRPELNWRQVVDKNVHQQREIIASRLNDMRELTERLGVSVQPKLTHDSEDISYALVVVDQQRGAVKKYGRDLVKAKDKDLPRLQEEIKEASTSLAHWLSAEALPFCAVAKEMKGSLERITNRIFAVELYAGLTEEVTKIRKGPPATMGDKVHVMQRRLYMDEECVAGYRVGGIDCRKISDFDEWLACKENFERILPFPRSAAAFRIRREVKHREWDGSLMSVFVNFNLEEADKYTFLYLRNGQQLYRLSTTLDFGPKLFPDKEEFSFKEKLWARAFAGSIHAEDLIPDSRYQEMVEKEAENARKKKAWMKEHKDDDHAWMHCPYHDPFYHAGDYQPFDPSSVYFDDIAKEIAERVNSYNRIAVILQGLLDRSTVFHPHIQARLWKPESFAAAVELVYDSLTLTSGETPDFDAYRIRCNKTLAEGMITVGQEDFWERREAKRENARRDRDWRDRSNYRQEKFRPYGNPGPGLLAAICTWRPRAQQATYCWQRDRQRYNRWGTNDRVPTSIHVPTDKLLNVEAYHPGDFRRFYDDCRTRMQYLRWAPLLLAAEEYHAGNLKLGDGKLSGGWDEP